MVVYDMQRTSNLSTGPPPFRVNPQSGVVTVAESPLSPGRHAIFIEASDQPANPSERRFSLAVVSVDVSPGGHYRQYIEIFKFRFPRLVLYSRSTFHLHHKDLRNTVRVLWLASLSLRSRKPDAAYFSLMERGTMCLTNHFRLFAGDSHVMEV